MRGFGSTVVGVNAVPPTPSRFAQSFTPRSERVANATHAYKVGGYAGKRGGLGGHARRSSAGGRGVRVRTPFGSAPPLQAHVEWGVAPCARGKQGAETGGGVYKVEEALQRGEG